LLRPILIPTFLPKGRREPGRGWLTVNALWQASPTAVQIAHRSWRLAIRTASQMHNAANATPKAARIISPLMPRFYPGWRGGGKVGSMAD
jgi:hypothetical protein